MADKARDCGLSFKDGYLVVDRATRTPRVAGPGIVVAPDPSGELHESRTRFYLLLPSYDRRLAGDKGAKVDGGALASSARTRHDADGGYRPPGLDEWLAGNGTISTVPDGR